MGFLAVANQLHLNRESMQQASQHSLSGGATSAEVALMGDSGYEAFAKSITNPTALTPGELVQFWKYMSIAQTNAQQAYAEYIEGRISEQIWLQARNAFVRYFNYPMGRVWFETTRQNGQGFTDASFWGAVNEGLNSAPRDHTSQWFYRMYQGARALEGNGEGVSQNNQTPEPTIDSSHTP